MTAAPAANKLELETFAGKSIQAYKEQAAKAGLVLRAPADKTETGDFPRRIYDSLRQFRRNLAITQNHKKIVTSIHRRLVSTRDDKGRPTKKEYITYLGHYSGMTHKGEEYHANFEIGRYEVPKIISNPNLTYNQRTGEPKGPEKALSGSEIVYTIEVPKTKEARKKLIDEIIGDNNFPEEVKYYFNNEGEPMGRSDPTFSYSDFWTYTIDELRSISAKGGGSLTPGIWRDADGKLRDKEGNLIQQ